MSGRSYLAPADALSFSFLFVLFSVLARVSFLARAAAAQPQVIEVAGCQRLRLRPADPPLCRGRRLDDLLHDDIIAELKVSRGAPATVGHSTRYLGQPTQYGVGRGSQLSILVVFDHGRKQAPPGVIDNYIDWLRPRLHGLDDPRYPSLVGVLM